MNQTFTVVEKNGRYFLWEGDHEYLTPCELSISSYDKGLVETIARKISENEADLVKLYLQKFDNLELVKIIDDLISADSVFCCFPITKDPELCAKLFQDTQLRELIDAYSECGSMNIAISVAINDEFDYDHSDYDPFFAGMAVTSGLCSSPEEEAAEDYYDMLYPIEEECESDIDEEIVKDFLENFIVKYNACLLPEEEEARNVIIDFRKHVL